MISVQNISYRIGTKQILDHISFGASPGELLVILGNNGAGKSTLLKVICNDLKPDHGTVEIDKRNIYDYAPQELAKKRAVLKQHTPITLPFKVREIVMMGRYPYFKSRETDHDKAIVNEAIAKAGITHLADQNYLSLSGGEQQRVQLARVLAQASGENTRYLLLDEPVNSLDVAHQHNTLQLAKTFAQGGNCVVAVLHDLNLAAMYADKILMLKSGKIAAYGTPEEVFTNETITHTFGFPAHVQPHPTAGCLMICFGTPAFSVTDLNPQHAAVI